jgi:hypothetical protein
MTVAWIIWHDLDAVRNEYDDYREKCVEWVFENDPIAPTQIGQIGPQNGHWHLHHWPLSGWDTLRLAAHLQNLREPRQQAILPPQVAIDGLWQAAGEGRINATAIEYKNAKAIVGDSVEIPAHHWPHLKPTDDRSTGKAILSGPDGRVYREVRFPRLKVKKLWAKSPQLPDEERDGPRKNGNAGVQQRRVLPVLKKLYPPDGKVPDDVPTETVRGLVNDELASENRRLGLREASWDSVNRALGRAPRR